MDDTDMMRGGQPAARTQALLQEYFTIQGDERIRDGVVDVNGNVVMKKSAERLPVIFDQVSGSFTAVKRGLTSLAGSPRRVGMGFDVSSNRLTSLVGSPREVEDFGCHNNPLESLEGMPEVIRNEVDVSHCGLGSLEGITPNARIYVVSFNDLVSIRGIQTNAKVCAVIAEGNRLSSLEGCPPNCRTLYIHSQKAPMKTLEGLPKRIYYIHIDDSAPMLMLLGTRINHLDEEHVSIFGKNRDKAQTLMALLKEYHPDGPDGAVPMAFDLIKHGYRENARF